MKIQTDSVAPTPDDAQSSAEPADGQGCAAAQDQVARGSAPMEVQPLVGALLRHTAELAAGAKQHTPSIDDKLDLLFAAAKLYDAVKTDPKAVNAFIDKALYHHDALCSIVSGLGSALSANPQQALVETMKAVASAVDQDGLAALESQLGELAPRYKTSGSTQRGSREHAGRSTRHDTMLGTFSGAAGAEAEAASRARGQAELGLDGVHAKGSAAARAGASAEVEAGFRNALADGHAKLRANAEVAARADGEAHADLTGVTAKGHAEAGATAEIEFDAEMRTKGVDIGGHRLDVHQEIEAQVEISAQAEADIDIAATYKPPRMLAELEASAFAGVKAGVEGSFGIGDFMTVSGEAAAWAGAGAEAGIVAGYDDGKLRFGFNLGAAVEVGAGASMAIEIDVAAIADAATSGVLHPIETMSKLVQALGLIDPEVAAAIQTLCPQVPLVFPPSLFSDPPTDNDVSEARDVVAELCRELLASDRLAKSLAKTETNHGRPKA